MEAVSDLITADTIYAAMEAVRTAPYRVCEHVVRPAPRGRRWAASDPTNHDAIVLRCANLCGFAMYVVAERVDPSLADPTDHHEENPA